MPKLVRGQTEKSRANLMVKLKNKNSSWPIGMLVRPRPRQPPTEETALSSEGRLLRSLGSGRAE